ncbi:acylphosphatase [Lutibacter sp.]|uniref:acylphosphatase n=1 Tax=Lutibacter sp. TaxID=1925666 RepID=UPI0025C56725|nr:acylphosphatase [Lutibacter sp.]MCF6168734.1 acylphosphatase [Lutibacter sp.]
MEKVLYKIVVEGKVQGVWFRKYTLNEALRLGLKGFVRNEINNTVYIEAEGNLVTLNEFVKWLYKGSPLSKVSTVTFKISELKYYKSFEIRS